MKVRLVNQELADMIAEELVDGRIQVGTIFPAWENHENWMDEDGTTFFCEVMVEQSVRTAHGYWAHRNEVEVLTPSEELSVLGHPGYGDAFAEQVLLFMIENDCPALVAIRIIGAKDIHVRDPKEET